jgi:hypothetical protein
VFAQVINGFIGTNAFNPGIEIDLFVPMQVLNDFNERSVDHMHQFFIRTEEFSCRTL